MTTAAPIVAATDFSPAADRALGHAARLAAAHRAPLVVVHAFDAWRWEHAKEFFRDTLASGYDRARERLERGAQALRSAWPSLTVDAAIVDGRASVVVGELATRRGARLVVIGQHGHTGVPLALGGTAGKLLRAAPCPVLVARREADAPHARALVAVDFSAMSARALDAAGRLFPGTALTAASVRATVTESMMRMEGVPASYVQGWRTQEQQRAQEELARFLAAHGHGPGSPAPAEARVVFGQAAAALLELARAEGVDLIAIGRHGGSATEERLMGSVTQNVVHHAPCDVLMVP
jgi:nucleotide-binding universal stress UspA family protein